MGLSPGHGVSRAMGIHKGRKLVSERVTASAFCEAVSTCKAEIASVEEHNFAMA